jgi:putative protease
MKREDLELLAPAGTYEALEAAVNAGADAVYLGGTAFGARQYAENFGPEVLPQAVKYAHLHRVKIYVTVNTLVDDGEMSQLGEYLVFLHNCGVDGIIVQDMGVIRLARKVVPNLPLHCSTQMSVTNSAGANFAYQAGMVKIVVARETTLTDMKTICQNTKGAVETFIHGALCVCYSGQCLMSSLIGGRSGNRGRCAQTCRLPYTLVNKDGENLLANVDAGQYLLSPRDMNTLDVLPQLIQSGVVSFKIEGRMKRPEYVAVVTDIYRRAIDSYLDGHYNVPEEDRLNIEQIFNRDFTTAYLEKPQGREMMSDRRPNNRGVLIGRVAELDKSANTAVIKLDKELHIGDGLEFWVSVGGRVGTELKQMLINGKAVDTAPKGSKVEISIPRGVRLNDRVFRTNDAKLMAYAGKFYGEHNKTRLPITAEVTAHLGEPLKVVLTDEDGHVGTGTTEFIVEAARKRPLTEEVIRKQVDRLGTTEFSLRDLILKVDEGVMVPMSEINEARRKAAEELTDLRLADIGPNRKQAVWHEAELTLPHNHTLNKRAQLAVEVDTLAKGERALAEGADVLILAGDCFTMPMLRLEDMKALKEKAAAKGRLLGIGTPRIVEEKQLAFFQKHFALWQELQPDFFLIANNGLWEMARATGIPVWGDFGLNTYNSQALTFWLEHGAAGMTLSPELTMQQVENLVHSSPVPVECLVDGPIEMMVSKYCVEGSFLGNLGSGKCSWHCKGQSFLKDRKNETFPLKHDQFGYMHILNSHSLSMITSAKNMEKLGIQRLRIDGRSSDVLELGATIAMYRQVLNGDTTVEDNPPHTTRGHYFRGVL